MSDIEDEIADFEDEFRRFHPRRSIPIVKLGRCFVLEL
jgi:hypothetical protein